MNTTNNTTTKAATNTTSSNQKNAILQVNNLKKTVIQGDSQLTILEQIDLAIYAGESCALIGESGSGKSTLLAILAGLDDGSEGEVKLLNQSLGEMSEDARAALRASAVGFVFQSFLLVPTLTAIENVQLPLLLKNGGNAANTKQSEEEAKALLAELGLGKRIHHLPAMLSGGEQQRVALARAFIAKPQILFADEPTGNLDRHTGDRIAELLFELNQKHGTTLILVTHDEQLAAQCQRQLRLVEGRLVDVSAEFAVAKQQKSAAQQSAIQQSAIQQSAIQQSAIQQPAVQHLGEPA